MADFSNDVDLDTTLVPTVVSAQPLENAIGELLDADDLDALAALLVAQHPADLADVLDRLESPRREAVFALLPPRVAAPVLSESGRETTNALLATLGPRKASELLDFLPADDAADMLTVDVPAQTEELLTGMNPAVASRVRALLTYPPGTAGRMMNEAFARVSPEATVAETFDHLRAVGAGLESFVDVFVVDRDDRLVGVASLEHLVLASPAARLGDVMTGRVVHVAPTDDCETAANIVAHYDLKMLPVVEDGRILGIVTVDDLLDVVVEEGTKDQLSFGAVEPGVLTDPYFQTPIWRVVRSRIGWLLLLFVAETATGVVLRFFEDELARVVALSFFIPLLIGTGGNTGAQTVSTIIRGLALKQIRTRDTGKVVARELLSGLLLGCMLAAVGFVRALLWGSGLQLSLVVALTLVAIVTWANTIGSLIPLVAQRFKVDPALVSAPLITTLVDASGLAIYLLIARALLAALH